MLTFYEKRAIARFVRSLNSEQRLELLAMLSRTIAFANQELARKERKKNATSAESVTCRRAGSDPTG